MSARANRMAARKYSDTKQGILYPKIKKEELNGKEIHQSGRSCKGVAWQNELLAYRDEKHKPYSQSYLKTFHNQLSAIFNHAVRFYDLHSNPAAKAGNMGSEERKEMLFWTKEEYQKFAEEMMDKPISYYNENSVLRVQYGYCLRGAPADRRHVDLHQLHRRGE